MQTIKKTISILLSLVMILSVFTIAPVRTRAQVSEDGVWEYMAIPEHGTTIVKYLGDDENVEIPNMLGNESVVDFYSNAFSEKSITSITFPSNIEIINEDLLKDHTELTKVTFADGRKLHTIGKDAFAGCTSLSEVTIPDSVENFRDGCFPLTTTICCTKESPAYTWFTTHNYNVVEICNHELIHVPASDPTKNSNGNTEYWYCSKCGKYFSDADGKNEITDSTKVLVPYFTFEYSNDGHYKLTGYNGNDEDITIPTVIPEDYPDTSLRGKPFSIIKEGAFKGNTTIKNVTIPDSIGHVGSYAFQDCSQLTEVMIGNGVDWLGDTSFANCPNLTKVTIKRTDKNFQMRPSSFQDSDKVTVYGYHGTKVEEYANQYEIPFESLGHYYGEPVWNWDGTSSATATFTCIGKDDTQTINATVTYVDTKPIIHEEDGERKYTATVTFDGKTYTDEKTVVVPKAHQLVHRVRTAPTVENNGWFEHWYCPECGKYYSDPNGETEITEDDVIMPYFVFEKNDDGDYVLAYYYGQDKNVIVPETIPDNYPVEEWRGKTISIIGERAFRDRYILETVMISDTIKRIEEYAFAWCSNLREVTIGTGITRLDRDCFALCKLLGKVTIYSKDENFMFGSSVFDEIDRRYLTIYGYHDTKVEELFTEWTNIRFAALEHIYDEPEWNWEGTASATAVFTCTHDDDTQTVEATITSEVIKELTDHQAGERQ